VDSARAPHTSKPGSISGWVTPKTCIYLFIYFTTILLQAVA